MFEGGGRGGRRGGGGEEGVSDNERVCFWYRHVGTPGGRNVSPILWINLILNFRIVTEEFVGNLITFCQIRGILERSFILSPRWKILAKVVRQPAIFTHSSNREISPIQKEDQSKEINESNDEGT
jgi:hypothetical protein